MTGAPTLLDAQELHQIVDYLETVSIAMPKPVANLEAAPPVAPPEPKRVLAEELAALPLHQLLHTYRQFDVYCGALQQMPAVVREITRLRELTFREMEEGSGCEVDTDEFDATYLHLLVWDREMQAIVGGYRLGRTDELLRDQGPDGVYLGIMFHFDPSFYSGPPMLEIGRSFVAPQYQRMHASLHLLWCGIGRYIVANPAYRKVYGVVSMSRLYDGRAVAAIRDALLEPQAAVTPKSAYEPDLGDQWRAFLSEKQPLAMKEVSQIVRALEQDERDVPVLIRHYHKLGARFVSAAVDGNFNNTPGLLLSLDVPSIPAKYLKQYLGPDLNGYLTYKPV